jgi:hypothetical protein
MLNIGAVCQITGCKEITGVEGAVGQVIDLQVQETDYTRAYPVWMEILSGEHRSKTYGFNYNEFEVIVPRIALPRELVAV